jgi:hypothetical protein
MSEGLGPLANSQSPFVATLVTRLLLVAEDASGQSHPRRYVEAGRHPVLPSAGTLRAAYGASWMLSELELHERLESAVSHGSGTRRTQSARPIGTIFGISGVHRDGIAGTGADQVELRSARSASSIRLEECPCRH